jgi:hypothetical protein
VLLASLGVAVAHRGRAVANGRGGECDDGFMAGEFVDIRSRLEQISEELADLAIARLRDSIDAGGHELPVDEKLITRARRAVDKAAALLAQGEELRRAAERSTD